MDDNRTYVKILIESLEKKIKILDQIIEKNAEQKIIISAEKLDSEMFEQNLKEKSELIDELENLDEGFQTVYNHVKEELTSRKGYYAKEIVKLQELISLITDKSILIQTEEERNKIFIQNHFSNLRKEVKQAKLGRKVAIDYYKSMSKTNMVEPQFLDKKK